MSKSWVHEDCLELVTNLADMKCSASISDGVLTLEDGTQIDLLSTAKKEIEDEDCLAAEMDSSDIEMLQEQLRKFSPPQEYDDE